MKAYDVIVLTRAKKLLLGFLKVSVKVSYSDLSILIVGLGALYTGTLPFPPQVSVSLDKGKVGICPPYVMTLLHLTVL